MTAPIVVLGPQRPTPNLVEALDDLGVRGPVCLINAGWRVDEDEISPLKDHIGRPVKHLKLYHEVERAFQKDDQWGRDYHRRQARVRAYKDVYRISMRAASSAMSQLYDRVAFDPDVYGPDFADAVTAVRMVDERLLERLDSIREASPEILEPWRRPTLAAVRERAVETIRSCDALLLAGGHVGVLRTRLRLLGLDQEFREILRRGVPIIAWSAGAMVLARRIVLFYDDPPEGHGDAEVFGRGLDLLPGAVWLPHAKMRLSLKDPKNIALFARRFGPEASVALEVGARVDWDGMKYIDRSEKGSCYRLIAEGRIEDGIGDLAGAAL